MQPHQKIRLWRGYHSPELRHWIERAWLNDELLIVCPPTLKDLSFVDLLHAPDYPRRPVLGVFTSGTQSGRPRLVLYSRECVLASLEAIRSLFDLRRLDSIFCYPQPFHTFGLILGYVHAIEYRLKLFCGEGPFRSPFHELRRQITETDASKMMTLGTPTHFHDLLSYTRKTGHTLAPSYTCIAGGAKVNPTLWRAMRDELLIEAPSVGYGATEASPGVTHLAPGREPNEPGEIGEVLPGVRIDLSQEGVVVTGPNLCLAVIEEGRLSFPSEILLRDRVTKRNDGVLIFEGRTDAMLNRGGQKISLEHLESVIAMCLGLNTVCVPVPDDRLGEDLGILLESGEQNGPAQNHGVLNSLSETLAHEFGLRVDLGKIRYARSLPTNDSGKLDRKRSLQMFDNAEASHG